jgi:ring-1,2-phenylacetyl-CoA epoxidase subunit PaaE
MAITYFPLPIREIIDETPDAYSVVFDRPEDEAFRYLPGQHLTIKLDMDGETVRRAFSLSSSPYYDDFLSITVKRVEGGKASNYIRDHMKAGDIVELLPPMGKFKVDPDPSNHKHYILIGGGSGITPLMSILKTVLAVEPKSRVTLWYCNRDEESIIFRQQLKALQKRYKKRLDLVHTLTRAGSGWKGEHGRLDEKRIYDLVSDLFMRDEYRKEYFICGPLGMIEAARAALDKHAVNPADVHRELYNAPPPSEDEVAVEYGSQPISDGESEYELTTRKIRVVYDKRPLSFEVRPDQSILDAAIEAELDPPFACQSGICTTCRAMLKAGVISMDETEGLSNEELQEGYILTCQSHPLTDDVEVEYR